MKKKGIVYSALILTLASIITKIMGFIYRVYMSNTIGAEGMGLLQLITPIYSLVWAFTASGITTTISKLVAGENAKNEYGNMGRILKQCVAISLIIAVFSSIGIFFLSDFIGSAILKDERCIYSLKILSVCFPFMAVGSCIRGYFFGLQRAIIPAISQVLEQFVRMLIVFLFAEKFIPKGLDYACLIAILGMIAGEISSFLFVAIFYKIFKIKHKLTKKPSYSSSKTFSLIFAMAFPLTLNRITGSLLSSVENILIPQSLIKYGLTSSQAISAFGKISAMAMPLIMFPSSLLLALSISLVPGVSEAYELKNYDRIKQIISKTLVFRSIIGIATTLVFSTYPYEISSIIYKKNNIAPLLFTMSIICPFLYLQVSLSGILNGLNEQLFIFKNSLLSSFISLFFIYFIMPKIGVSAFICGWFISLVVTSFLNILRIKKRTNFSFDINNLIIKPLICAIFSAMASKIIFDIYSDNFTLIISLTLSLIFFGLTYLLCLYLTETIKD